MGRPGYYWLAYAWDNLFFACQLCNQRHKRNLFPLRDPAGRARSHRDDLTAEEPLFIHPASGDPAEVIGFREEVPYPVNGDGRGRAMIDGLGLQREPLNEMRRDRLEILRSIRRLAAQGDSDARSYLAKAVADAAPYAAMARALLAAPE